MYKEFRRRLLHIDTLYSKAEKEEVVRVFIDSDYKHKTRKEIILSAVRKYYRQILEQETGRRQLYRSAKEMVESRRMKSLQNKTWFKSKRGRQNLTPRKDLPHYVQSIELEDRKSARKVQEAGISLDGNQEEEGRSSSQTSQETRDTQETGSRVVKEVETVIFIPQHLASY